MKIPSSQSSGSFLRSPIILGGLAVVLIALIVVVALGVLGGGNGGDNGGSATKTAGTSSPKQTESSDHLTGKAKSTVNVRSDPGNAFQALGVLRNGTEVEIVAKSEDGEWFQIVYPSGSNLRGWVLAESLEVTGDLSGLGVATPEHIPVPVAPTSPVVTQPTTPTPSNLTPTPSPTPPIPLPDLVISGTVISGGKLVITVTDQGLGPLTSATVAVSVFDLAGTGLLGSGSAGPLTLTPGASIDIKTDYAIQPTPVQLLVIVDPQGTIAETDDTNNRLSVAIGGGGPTPTQRTTEQPTQQPTTQPTHTPTPQH
jgi:uncharacterized protein YraI